MTGQSDIHPREAVISIQFTGYWLAGTGAARGHAADTFAYRDRLGHPAMPMSQIKGQLKETAARLAFAGAGGWNPDVWGRLFGAVLDDESTIRASVDFGGDARIAPGLREHLKREPDNLGRLFSMISSTSINQFGVAADMTLRTVEAVAPLSLFGRVRWIGTADPDPDWVALLDTACAATLAFGKQKADGFGRAIAKAEAVPSPPPVKQVTGALS